MDTTESNPPTPTTVLLNTANLKTALQQLGPKLNACMSAYANSLLTGTLQTLLPSTPGDEIANILSVAFAQANYDLSPQLSKIAETLETMRKDYTDLIVKIKAGNVVAPSPLTSLPTHKTLTPALTNAILSPNKTLNGKELLTLTTTFRLALKQSAKDSPTAINNKAALDNPTSYASTLLRDVIGAPEKAKKIKDDQERATLLATVDPKDRILLETLNALTKIMAERPNAPPTQIPSQNNNKRKASPKKDNSAPPPQQSPNPPKKGKQPSSPTQYPLNPLPLKRENGRHGVPFGLYRAHGIHTFVFTLPTTGASLPQTYQYTLTDGKYVKRLTNAANNTPINKPPPSKN